MKEANKQRILAALKDIIGDASKATNLESLIPEEMVETLADNQLRFYLQHEILHLQYNQQKEALCKRLTTPR
jgi:hypothetical protein